jgi:periplasmic divalent cation tolerance protein
MKYNELFVILSTCPDAATAERLGRALVEASLAACVNVLPGLRSIYRWNEAVQSDEEVLMIVKTVADGHHPYLSWVASSTRAP